jgi:HMG (high mobility group) box
MSITIEMLTARIETLEKQIAIVLKDTGVPIEVKKVKKSKGESSDDEVEVKKTKKEPKAKKEVSSEDEDKPKKKRGTNGYLAFSKSVREEVIATLSVGDEKPKNTDIMKKQAAMWGELTVDEKAVWNAKAKETNDEA